MVTFYFDLGSPYAYLTAERIDEQIPDADWQPILLGGLFKLTGRSSWARGDQARREQGMAEIERRAESYGLPPMRWPDPWPSNYLFAMRAATHAFAAGQGREFVGQAFRAAFRDGVDLSERDHVIQVLEAVGLRGDGPDQQPVKQTLRDATDAAHERGVSGVPTVAVDAELFWGDDRLEDAVRAARA